MVDLVTELRKKYKKYGYSSLTDKEKIILLLSFSEKGESIIYSADKIHEIYGNLHIAADSDVVFMQKICEISSESAVLINLISQLKRKSDLELLSQVRINTPENSKRFFTAFLRGKHLELVAVAAADKRFKIKHAAVIAYGGFSEVHFPMRAITDFALKNGQEYIFIAHSHPVSDENPSQSDISTTLKIKKAVEAVGMKFVDHIIVGIDSATSLREYNYEMFSSIPEYDR
ncbi:MAG: JAB domain-containing protein [Ruminococcus sp.]|nr:JAB domain-containing protein [Ruminococcus sp.]